MNNDRIWTKEYILLMGANFCVAANFYALMTTVTSFAISVLGVNETKAGFGAGIFVVGALLSRIFISRYAARVGFKKMLIIGISALILFTALLFAVNDFILFCVIRFLGGMTFGVNNNTINTIVTYIIPQNRKGEGVGWFSLSQIIGMAIGPFFAVSIMYWYGFNEVFLLVTILAVVSLVIIIIVKIPAEALKAASPRAAGPSGEIITIPPEERGFWQFFERTAIKIAILLIILYMCNSNYMSFAAVFVTASGAPNLSSAIFLANAGAMLVSRPFVGKIFDKYGPNLLLVIGFICFAGGLLLLGQGIVSAFIPSSLLIGLGISSTQGTTQFIMVSESPRHRLTVANATYFLALDFGAAIGPTIGGRIAEQTSYGLMFTICAIVVIACMPLYFFVLAKKPNRAHV